MFNLVMRLGAKGLSRISWLLMASLAFTSPATGAPGFEKPIPVPVKQLPRELVVVVKERFPHGKITQAEHSPPRAMDEGGFMGLTIVDGKKEFRVTVSCMNADYKINSISHEIAPSELPKFVLEAIRAKYPQADINSVREVQSGLMGWAEKYAKPSEYFVRINPPSDAEIELFLTPDFKPDAAGNYKPDPGKVHIENETTMATGTGKTWKRIDNVYFSFFVPPSFKKTDLHGIDSFAEEYVADGIKLEFDYGMLSTDFSGWPQDTKFEESTIDGETGKIGTKGQKSDDGFHYFTQVDFKSPLTMFAFCKSDKEVALAKKIFATVTFKK